MGAKGGLVFKIQFLWCNIVEDMKMLSPKNDYIARKGQELYDTKLKALLEPEKNGMFVAIEPDSEDYFVGETMAQARQRASKVHPEKYSFL